MPFDTDSANAPRPARNSLERLYALWMITTFLLLLALVVIVFLVNARLRAQSALIEDQSQRQIWIGAGISKLGERTARS